MPPKRKTATSNNTNGTNNVDPISLNRIPKRYKVMLPTGSGVTKAWNARGLQKMLNRGNERHPLTRQPLTAANKERITEASVPMSVTVHNGSKGWIRDTFFGNTAMRNHATDPDAHHGYVLTTKNGKRVPWDKTMENYFNDSSKEGTAYIHPVGTTVTNARETINSMRLLNAALEKRDFGMVSTILEKFVLPYFHPDDIPYIHPQHIAHEVKLTFLARCLLSYAPLDVVERLLTLGADPNRARGSIGPVHALVFAAGLYPRTSLRVEPYMDALIRAGANVDEPCSLDRTPLMLSLRGFGWETGIGIGGPRYDVAETLILKYGANVPSSPQSFDPLYKIVTNSMFYRTWKSADSLIRLLLRRGSSVSSALKYVCVTNSVWTLPVLKLFLDNTSKEDLVAIDTQDNLIDYTLRYSDDTTASTAAKVELLLLHGAKVTAKTLVHAVDQNKSVDSVKRLLDHGGAAYIDTGVPMSMWPFRQQLATPLMVARSPEVVDLLLERGASIEKRLGNFTPLQAAVVSRCPKVVIRLLERGANPRRRVDGKTALEYCRSVRYGMTSSSRLQITSILRAFIEKGRLPRGTT